MGTIGYQDPSYPRKQGALWAGLIAVESCAMHRWQGVLWRALPVLSISRRDETGVAIGRHRALSSSPSFILVRRFGHIPAGTAACRGRMQFKHSILENPGQGQGTGLGWQPGLGHCHAAVDS